MAMPNKNSRQLLGLVALTVGAWVVRVRHLDGQLLGGDELHLLRVISARSYLDIAGLVTETDYSIPLALFAKALAALFPLGEWALRLPVLLVGSLAPAIFALGARRLTSPGSALLLGMVVAVHPFFIFYSRFVRPYGFCVVLLFVALVLLDRWLCDDRRRDLLGAVCLAAIASWLQLVSLIAAGWFFVATLARAAGAGREAAGGATRRPQGQVLLLSALGGLACLAATLILLGPALSGIEQRVVQDNLGSGSLGEGAMRSEILWRNAAVLTGLPGKAPALLFLALALTGIFVLARRSPAKAIFLLIPAVGHPLTILILKPNLLAFSFVLARYVFYVLPIWLLFASVAVEWGFRLLSNRLGPGMGRYRDLVMPGTMAAACVVWLALGPYWRIYDGTSNYAHHNAYQTFAYLSHPRWQSTDLQSPNAPLPPFYRSLTEPGISILEGPAPEGFFDNPAALYQHFHRRPIKLVAVAAPNEYPHAVTAPSTVSRR